MQLLTMADVQHLKEKGIPLKVDGTIRYVKGATKYTTCGDVIKMVLKKTGIKKEYRHLFAIYEVSLNTEKPLPCKSRITKIINSWKGEPNRLVLRKSDPLTPVILKDKRRRWNLKKKTTQNVDEPRKLPDLQTLTSLVEMVDKHKNRAQRGSSSHSRGSEQYVDSTSDSDSSMDEFLSKLDHSKINGLINFFAAIAMKKQRKSNYRRSNSGSTNESADSSDTSPVRPRRRKVKSSLAKKAKTRNSRSRLRESADVHPNKMHAVQMVNFGFIDIEPRSHDRVYSLSDMHSSDEQTTGLPSRSAKTFTARRRLIPTKRQRYSVKEDTCFQKFRRTISDDPCKRLNEPYNTQRHPKNCQELFCQSPLRSIDSGHGEESDSSTDLDAAFVFRNIADDVKNAARKYIETPEHGRIFRTYASEKPVTSSARKLVEYSITDDELDASDIIDITTTSETEDENSDHEMSVCRTDNFKLRVDMGSGDNENRPGPNNVLHETRKQEEVNSNVTAFIKSVFGKEVVNEDEEMNSFMKSMVLDESSDEGLSSMGSDLEKDLRLRV